PRGHQNVEEPVSPQAERRRDGVVRRCASAVPARPGRAAGRPLAAMGPVSGREKADRPGRNQVSGMFSRLETHIADPAERLRAIAKANSTAKEHSSAIAATLLQDWSQFAAHA